MAIAWREWTDSEAAARWDAQLAAWPDHTLYQGYRWGEFKRRCGWEVRRGEVLLDGQRSAMAQCLVRECSPLRLVMLWVPGGPVGRLAGRVAFRDAIQQRYGGWRMWARAHMLGEARDGEPQAFTDAGWRRPAVRLSASHTLHLDLTAEEAVRRAALTSNWRHNLARGERRHYQIEPWESDRPLKPVYAVYHAMTRLKGIPAAMSLADLELVRSVFGRAFALGVARDDHGQPCAMRAFIRTGDRAQDFMAAVSEDGRKRYANYPLTWQLLEWAHQQGVRLYDLNGAVPGGAAGVFNFKRGLGGRLVPLVGEWEWATAAWLRWSVNLAIRWRGIS